MVYLPVLICRNVLHLRLFVRSCFLILTFITTTNAQWSTQSPIPTNLNISGIGAPTSNRIFISTDDNSFDDILILRSDISNLANLNTGTCLSCLYSRPNKDMLDLRVRKCVLNYTFKDQECLKYRDEFIKCMSRRKNC